MPFLVSFENKWVKYSSRFKYLFPAIGIVGLLFIVWDMYFTQIGIWWFSEQYITGIHIGNLPLEEVLFFICIPFSSIFIHDVLEFSAGKSLRSSQSLACVVKVLFWIVTAFCAVCYVIYFDNYYTSWTFGFIVIWNLFYWFHKAKNPAFNLPTFFISFFIVLIPFFIVNGLLTAIPVVNYNEAEQIGMRMFTVPFEDAFYAWLMLFPAVYLYKWFASKY